MITALHGFLGLPSDWDFLRAAGLPLHAVDLFDDEAIPEAGDTLLGYSMGGRLALGALVAGATYRRAIIVSAGLNLEQDQARNERRASDEQWARRFESGEWDEVMSEWNDQPVFGGHAVPRREQDFERESLARGLRAWSPGLLPALAPSLQAIDVPILWIAGERDHRYVEEGRRAVALLPQAGLSIAPGAGHRVPWEEPEWFVERVVAFLANGLR